MLGLPMTSQYEKRIVWWWEGFGCFFFLFPLFPFFFLFLINSGKCACTVVSFVSTIKINVGGRGHISLKEVLTQY